MTEETVPKSVRRRSSRARKRLPHDRRLRDQELVVVIAALLLALLAPALGGGASLFAIAILLTGVGLAAVLLPAKRVQPGYLVCAALVLLAMFDWAWPASFVHLPWRERLAGAGFPLAWCISPEPWISLRGWLVLLGGLTWAGWCSGQPWRSRARKIVCEALAVGIGLIALVAMIFPKVPGWPGVALRTGLGPFENRNQTATLFALGAFLALVSGAELIRKRAHSWNSGSAIVPGFLWLALLGIYTGALALNDSRSGPLLFLGMTLAWLVSVVPPWKRKPSALIAGAAVALLLGAIFLLTGREVITRLLAITMMDFRLKIFQDTFQMIRASLWTGAGLGCFEPIFPLYRAASIIQVRVLHPESDWLWLLSETGLAGAITVAALAIWLGSRAFRAIGDRRDRRLQIALCIACLGVLAHSFIDVPGHRLGTLMPALLLVAMAAGGDGAEKRWANWVLRGAGLLVFAMGATSLALLAFQIPVPVLNGVDLLADRAWRAGSAGHGPGADGTLRQAIAWAPLDWHLYVEKAELEGARGEWTGALGDFRRARFLEPNFSGLPFEEGVYWLNIASEFAVECWQETLRRTEPERRPAVYENILGLAYTGHPDLHPALWSLALGSDETQLAYLEMAVPGEFRQHMGEMLRDDRDLRNFSPSELRRLFPIWMQKGDARQLALLINQNPSWLKLGYRTLAEYDASKGDLPAALELMRRFLPAPLVPAAPSLPFGEAARRFAADKSDIVAALAVYHEDMAKGRETEALDTLERLAAASPANCPPYIHYLEGQLLAKEQKTAQAWQALSQCPDSGRTRD